MHFEAEFNGKVIKGKIKEKEEAKLEYKENKKMGNIVAYSEKKIDNPDIMIVELGNIPPKTFINIKYEYS